MARVTGLLGWISDKASDAYDWYKEQDTPLSAYLRGDSVVDATSRSLDKFGENLSNPEYAMDWVSPLGVVGSIAKKTASKVYDPLYEWQKPHLENQTGTNNAYKPNKISKNSIKKKYETWKV